MRQMPQDIAEPSAFALEFNFAQVRVRDFLLEDVYCYLLGTFGMSREQKDRGTRACYIKVWKNMPNSFPAMDFTQSVRRRLKVRSPVFWDSHRKKQFFAAKVRICLQTHHDW